MTVTMRRRLTGMLVLGLIGLWISGCAGGGAGGGGSASSGNQAVNVGAVDYQFNPSTITVKAGQPVQLTLRNNATQIHDFTIDSLGGQKIQVTSDPQASSSTTFTPTAPGTYKFYCNQPGHEQLGMVGQLTVQ